MLAIHSRPNSFSDNWIRYCDCNDISYKLVDCYSSGIVDQMRDFSGLMWHWSHYDHKAVLFARQLTHSLELMGKKVFPNFNTCWHFDDKVGQKYLLEAVDAPLVPSYIFYDKQNALEWAMGTQYPKVFKLRCGASSENVRLVRDFNAAAVLIDKAFAGGFSVKSRTNFLHEYLWRLKRDRTLVSFLNVSKGFARLIIPKEAEINFPKEKNYVYFQEFIPDNDYDIRVIIVGRRAFAIKRLVRAGDFRASGSGAIVYEPNQIPCECLQIAFDLSKKMKTQCLAYDFVFQKNEPLVVEVSYAFSQQVYLPCPGYWDENLNLISRSFTPEYFMVEDFLKEFVCV